MVDIRQIYETGRLFDGHYRLLKPLSTAGGSADVWLAADVNTVDGDLDVDKATKVAIKIYRPRNIIDMEGEFQFRNEFRKVFSCHHENIIQPTYFSIFQETPYLVMPYCPAGSSENLIGRIKDSEGLWKYICQVASGLAYLHEHVPQIIHQDIKPANVLIDDNGNYAITDFGISAEMGGMDAGSEDESGGTFAYMAPERFAEGTPPMPESDIWAFGATIYEMISGDVPFGNEGGRVQDRDTAVPPLGQDVPESIRQLVCSCLSYDPASRPTARGIVDMVMKRRYSKNRKLAAIISAVAVCVSVILVVIFASGHTSDVEENFSSMCGRGDALVAAEADAIARNGGVPDLSCITGLEQAVVLYHNACNDVPKNFKGREAVLHKVELIEELAEEIRKYDRARDLTEKALMTEMEDMYLEYSSRMEQHKEKISQLILQIQ